MMEEDAAANSNSANSNSANSNSNSSKPRRINRQHKKKGARPLKELPQLAQFISSPLFIALFGLLLVATGISFWLVLVHPDGLEFSIRSSSSSIRSSSNTVHDTANTDAQSAHHHHPAAAAAAAAGYSPEEAEEAANNNNNNHLVVDYELEDGPHLTPRLPHLPIFAPIPNGDALSLV